MTPTPAGQRLKELRDAAGLSQAELSQQSGVAAATISEIEAGKVQNPRRSTLSTLERSLGRVGSLTGTGGTSASLDDAIELLSVFADLGRDGRISLLAYARGLQDSSGSLSIDV